MLDADVHCTWPAAQSVGGATGANVNGDTFLPDLSSYDYDTLISEAGATGQPGTDGPNKYKVGLEGQDGHPDWMQDASAGQAAD